MRRSKWLVILWIPTLILTAFSAGSESSGDAFTEDGIALGEVLIFPDGMPALQPHMSSPGGDDASGGLVSQPVEMLAPFTGPGSPSRTDERWNIAGADLGFSFEGDGNIYMVFGDTWGRSGTEGPDWRSNTMVVVEPDATHGFIVTDAVRDENDEAIELLPSLKQAKQEYTVIPTTGIAIDGRMYLHYLSVNDWDRHWWGYKKPVPNGSGLAYSDDQGQTWIKDERATWPGDSPFAQAAMVQRGDFVYAFGTPAGRFGAAQLLRVESDRLLEPEEYRYWTGDRWSSDASLAAEVVPAPVGELSVRWSSHHQLWFMMYTNEMTHASVLRSAEQLTGPWGPEEVVVTAERFPTSYGPLMLPITGSEVYFTMSIFEPDYQVYLMRVTLNDGLQAD
ncbi:MAG: DUF4185 domain-containing protein [Chloroflexia bacterium]|nr:DUF4185 domain-containing protein [Chloroflexia bacterium]